MNATTELQKEATGMDLQMAAFYEDESGFESLGFKTYATREEALKAAMAAHPAGKRLNATEVVNQLGEKLEVIAIRSGVEIRDRFNTLVRDERGDVPGWVLVVLMTTGLVTAIWAIAKPNLTSILNNSLNSMNNVR
ncbi:MAG: hypothetical protein ACKN92_08900 [Candidatus Nanopelagicaceae bacterium]